MPWKSAVGSPYSAAKKASHIEASSRESQILRNQSSSACSWLMRTRGPGAG